MHKYNKNFLLLFSRGEISGYGHYKRSSLIEKYIKKNITSCVKKICIDDIEFLKSNIYEIVKKKIKKQKFKFLILDLNYFYLKPFAKVKKILLEIKKLGILIIGIDSLRSFHKYLSYVWIPSPYKESILKSKNIFYGWDKMIFNRYNFSYIRSNKILFLLGSSKNIFVSKNLPRLIENQIPKKFELHWVLGKYSVKPKNVDPDRWIFYKGVDDLSNLLKKTGFVFSTYGLSLFESLSCGIPTVSYCSINNYKKDRKEINFFKKKNICPIETDINKAVLSLKYLVQSKKKSLIFSPKDKFFLNKPDFSFLKKFN